MNYSGIPISRTLSLTNLPITRTKRLFPSSVKHCNFTSDFTNSPIFRANFCFPWRFVKSEFHCIGPCSTKMVSVHVKPRPNDRNMPTQHIATLWGATCCVRYATMHVATCCDTQHIATHRNTVAKRSQHAFAICYVGMLRSFGLGLRFMIFFHR